jgi:signal transduction histidine kinase/DNA-binding response OmpR family regulator
MPPSNQPQAARDFLSGGGELGTLMRAFDWTRTPLGPPEHWPHGLKTAVRIMLTSRQAMWIGWGPELTYLYNDAYKSIIGGKHPIALGQPTSVVWREIWGEVGPRLAHVIANNEGTYDEGLLLIMERNGYPEETYYTFSYSPVPDDQGGTGGIICANTEETDQILRERQLALLRQLAASGAEARTEADACDLAGRALEADPRDFPFALLYRVEDGGSLALCARTGLPAGHPLAAPRVDASASSPWPIADVLRTSLPVVVDLSSTGQALPSGPWDRPPARAAVVPLAGRGQAAPAAVLVLGLNPYRLYDRAFADFVQLVAAQIAAGLAGARAYEEERSRAEALAELDRAKTAFFSNVSHELRTPLTLILGPLQDLRDGAAPPDVREQATLMHRNASRLLRLVNTLLDFSRIEAGRVQAAFEPLDLALLTRDLASTFRSAMERAGLELVVDCPPLGTPVHVDRQMWEKVVLNLISNAFKYTLQGSVTVTLTREGETARLTVEDTGIGIPAAELPRLFDRFHRVEGARGRTHEGSGIGLALVQEVARLHGGAVAAESEPGRGSTFTVSIPLGTAHLPVDRVRTTPASPWEASDAGAYVEEALRWLPDAEERPAARSPDTRSAERVLLADDNADMRDYVRRLLEPRWQVEVAANGLAALEAARRERPHLVVTDVMMPELDGFGLLAALRADPSLDGVPVLMLSARAGEEATLEGVQAGADGYLVKPFSARELTARVESLLLRARIRAVEETHARRLSAVFAQAPVGIAVLRGPLHVFESANAPYRALVGGRDVVGRPIREALSELQGQGVYELLDAVRHAGLPHVGRSLGVLIDRGAGVPEESFFDFVYQPILDADGAPDGIVVIAYDVTELARARRDAEVANRAKDEFLAMLGHELRNPLAPITTALQLLRLRGIEAGEKERLIIERQVRHLVTLVDDLLDVSRITRGKLELTRSRVELSEVVAKAIETASPLFEQHHHLLEVDVPTRGLPLEADAARLAQAVANLLTNAAKYTEPGGRITVSAAAEAGDVVLHVRDTGIGIDPEILPRIFELFVQERQALDRSRGGLGLGLAIVRSLVTLHGGSVTARSPGRGQGAVFTVRLPGADRVVAAGPPAAGAAAPAVPALTASGRPPRRVLVVDDNEDGAHMLAETLRALGHQVACAYDGPSALATAASFAPDVALLDIGLPVMNGYEVAQGFRRDGNLRRTRLVAITGYGQEQDRERSVASGFVAHLVKPVDFERLRALVEADSA